MTDSSKTASTIFHYALKIFLVISTLFYISVPDGSMTRDQILEWGYMSQELFFRYGVVLLFGLSLFLKPVRIFNLKSAGSLLVYLIMISIFMKFDVSVRRSILNIFFALLFFKIVVENVKITEYRSIGLWLFWLLVANLVLCVLQMYGRDPIFYRLDHGLGIKEAVGFMRIKATLGVMTAILTPLLFMVSPYLVLVSIPLLYFSEASSAVLATLLALGFILYFRMSRRMFLLICGVLVGSILLYVFMFDLPGMTSSWDRFQVWFAVISDTLKKSPFFGLGIGSFAGSNFLTSQVSSPEKLRWIWVHNEFIQAFFEMGIAGLVIVIAFVRGRFRDFKFVWYDRMSQCLFAGFLAVLVVCFFNFPFHTARTVPIMMMVMAMFHARMINLRSGNET